MQIYKKAGRKDAKELAKGSMEDESTMTGPLSAVMSLVQDTLSDSDSNISTSFSGPPSVKLANKMYNTLVDNSPKAINSIETSIYNAVNKIQPISKSKFMKKYGPEFEVLSKEQLKAAIKLLKQLIK